MGDFRNLKSHDEWSEAWPVLHSLRPDLDREAFLASRDTLLNAGYRLFGAFLDGKCVSVAGYRIYLHVTRARECWVHDLATLEEHRSRGLGKSLLEHIEREAKSQGCSRVKLYTRVHRKDAQRFYETKAGYARTAYVYCKDLP